MAQRRTLADRRRQQLIALLYAHGGGMALDALLEHADSPLIAETLIYSNPDWFAIGRGTVRLAWVSSHAVGNARTRRRGGVA